MIIDDKKIKGMAMARIDGQYLLIVTLTGPWGI